MLKISIYSIYLTSIITQHRWIKRSLRNNTLTYMGTHCIETFTYLVFNYYGATVGRTGAILHLGTLHEISTLCLKKTSNFVIVMSIIFAKY